MPKFLYILVLTGMWALNSYAQNPDIKRTWHWYFGAGAGLDFSSGTAVADTTGKLHSSESCAVMSDTAGNLLFYTDGDTVWDRRHIMMPSGYGLKSCGNYIGSSAKGTIIIPQPQNDSIYYILTVDCWENLVIDGLRYSVVNLNKNSGYGDVTLKNKLLFSNVTEGITATKSITGDTIWVVTHEYNNDIYRIYKIDKNGLDTVPILNKIGGIHSDYVTYSNFSPDGRKLVSFNYGGVSDLFDFDLKTGKLSNHISLPDGGYGACFSYDNSKLYFTRDGNTIVQFDLCSENIPQSLIVYHDIYAPDNSTYGAIVNTSDTSLLLISSVGKDSISFIKKSNSVLDSSMIFRLKISLGGRLSGLGLPNFIQSYFYNNTAKDPCNLGTINEIYNTFLYISNIFTPNGDNINDYFSIQIAGYKNIAYFIYNRWGTLIHQGQKELQPEIKTEETLWDGRTSAGKEASDGVYYYILNLTNTKNETETKKGYIQLLR